LKCRRIRLYKTLAEEVIIAMETRTNESSRKRTGPVLKVPRPLCLRVLGWKLRGLRGFMGSGAVRSLGTHTHTPYHDNGRHT